VTGQQTDQEPREECGVFGVWAPGEEVAKLTYYGLYALQHRGQEAAGIAVADGSQVLVFKDLGLVSQVFDEQTLAAMEGHVAIGHCRYSTSGFHHVGERPAGVPQHRRRHRRRTRSQRQPGQCHRPGHPRPRSRADRDSRCTSRHDGLRHPRRAAGPRRRRRHLGAGRPRPAADGAWRLLSDLHGREHPLCGPRPLRCAAVVVGAAGPRLGGGVRDRRAGHRRRLVRPRYRTG